MTDRMSQDRAGLDDDGFLAELERAAKGLSLVTDKASSEELRRLVGVLHEDGRQSAEAASPSSAGP